MNGHRLADRRRKWALTGSTLVFLLAGAACSGGDNTDQDVGAATEDVQAEHNGQSVGSPLCATSEEAARVQEFYAETRPGAVLPIPGRKLNLVESKVASGLSPQHAVGVDGTPERLAEIWRSVDAWGEETNVRAVVSIDGWHPFDFPSKTPVTQEKHSAGFYDVYADGGKGVHIHLKPEDIKLIYAANLPGTDGSATRSVNLYDSDGRLVLGVYASKAGNADFDAAAVEGFSGSWDVIASMPRACARESVEG